MEFSYVEAVAPATSANLGAGFDVFSLALEGLQDRVGVEIVKGEGITIKIEGVEAESIPVEPRRNTAGIVAENLLKLSNRKYGLSLKIMKGIKSGSGLGSSAASAAAATIAINELLSLNLSKEEMIMNAAQGEIASAEAAHADNVSSAILGFFTIVRSYDPLEVVQLTAPQNLEVVISLPEIEMDTAKARSVLPERVKLSDLVHNVGNATAFVAGLSLGDLELMGRSLEDSIIEPARAHLIPGLSEVKEKASQAGAVGVTISGAGPSVIALADERKEKAKKIAGAMKDAFMRHGISSQTICTRPGPGARIVRRQ
ncbi:MAG: homoserine kinase [Thermoproteota archaeon]